MEWKHLRINNIMSEGVGFVKPLVVGHFVVVGVLGNGILDQLGERYINTILFGHYGSAQRAGS